MEMAGLWADHGQALGDRSERHEKPFGKASLYLDKQVYGPHRANGYVKYMVQPYWADQSHDPTREGGTGRAGCRIQASCGSLRP